MRTTPDEARTVLRAQLGDRDALEAVLRTIQPPLRRFVSRIVGPTEADDVVQNTLITIARKVNWLEEPRLFRAWAIMWAAFIAGTLLMACCTAIVMFHVSRVGRTILKSIELSKGNNSKAS